MTYDETARAALCIAHMSRTHREAVETIVSRNLADDEGEADSLIYEGERLESAADNTSGADMIAGRFETHRRTFNPRGY